MKILHTLGGFSIDGGGGVTTCTYQLLKALRARGVDIDVLAPKRPGQQIIGEGEPWIKTVPCDYRTPLCLSRNLKEFLAESDYDIYHSNGLWMHINHITPKIARAKKRPYIISPHGMLFPEALHRSYTKKWPLIKLWFGNDIARATTIHATCQSEADAVGAFGYHGRIDIIPNLTVIPDYTSQVYAAKSATIAREPRHIGFLGRLHPVKGIEHLIQGLAMSGSGNSMQLDIIGMGEQSYVDSLKKLASDLGLADNVNIVGFVDGRAKFEALARLSALFVPSDFENFGMIVPEALVVGTTVMASTGTPWQELNDRDCGWWRDRSARSIAEVIDTIAAMTDNQLCAMGSRGRDLVLQKYSADAIAGQFIDLYNSL
jgi:glycosyltransferase involved in cell wall biosynthesis